MEINKEKSVSEDQDAKTQSNSSHSNIKDGPFFNFLKLFRMRHSDWTTTKAANVGAKLWANMSNKEKDKFKEISPIQAKNLPRKASTKKTNSRTKSRPRKLKYKGKPKKRTLTKAVKRGIRSRPTTAKSVKRGGKGVKNNLMVKSSAEASIMRMLESIKKMRKDLAGKGKANQKKRRLFKC